MKRTHIVYLRLLRSTLITIAMLQMLAAQGYFGDFNIIDSGGTIVNAASALKEKGAKDVYVYITHAVLSGNAVERIEKSEIKKLITTDTIDNSKKITKSKKVEILSLAPMISEAMKRIANSTSVSSLFN